MSMEMETSELKGLIKEFIDELMLNMWYSFLMVFVILVLIFMIMINLIHSASCRLYEINFKAVG